MHRIGRTGRAGLSGLTIMLMTGSDERAVAAIERLTKQKFDIQAVSSFGRREPERGRERGARPERRGREDLRRPSQSAPKPVDEFFTKPYEPSTDSTTPASPESPVTPRRPAGRVSALLGGGKK
jgi:superfamily II DNA/RNA helicase